MKDHIKEIPKYTSPHEKSSLEGHRSKADRLTEAQRYAQTRGLYNLENGKTTLSEVQMQRVLRAIKGGEKIRPEGTIQLTASPIEGGMSGEGSSGGWNNPEEWFIQTYGSQEDSSSMSAYNKRNDRMASGEGSGEEDKPYGNIESALWYNTPTEKRWKLIRDEKDIERAREWQAEQSGKNVVLAEFEKGLINRNTSGITKRTNYMEQFEERKREIASLSVLYGKNKKHRLINQMTLASYELYSQIGHNDPEQIKQYEDARQQFNNEFKGT